MPGLSGSEYDGWLVPPCALFYHLTKGRFRLSWKDEDAANIFIRVGVHDKRVPCTRTAELMGP